MRILKTASGIASRCGSSAMPRAFAAIVFIALTSWLAMWLGWVVVIHDCPRLHLLATLGIMVYVIGSLVTMYIMSESPSKWTLETMTRYAPFMVWRAIISDGRTTAWKLLLWPLLVPAESLVCLWLATRWLARLLDIDLSKTS